MALPLIPLAIAAVVGVVALVVGKKSAVQTVTKATSPFWKPISPDVPPGNVFFQGAKKTTPLVDRIDLRIDQVVAIVLELPGGNPAQNPHVLAQMRVVTKSKAGGPAGPSTTYGLQFLPGARMLFDRNTGPNTPRPDPSVSFIVSPAEIALVGGLFPLEVTLPAAV